MSHSEKTVAKGSSFLSGVAVVILALIICWGCEPRFKVGDKVGIPPLPPSDSLIGLFDKAMSSDLTGNVYRLRDLPDNPLFPIGLNFDGKFRLFFLYQGAIMMGTMQPASPYIDTGDDGVADSGLGFDDVQVNSVGSSGLTSLDVVVGPGKNSILDTLVPRDTDDIKVVAVVPGVDGGLDTTCDPADSTSNDGNYCLPGDNGVLEDYTATLTDDDQIGEVILAGPDGIADSGLYEGDIQRGAITVPAAPPYKSRIGIIKNQGEPNRKAVKPNDNTGRYTTTCVYDDNTRYNDNASAIVNVGLTDGIYTGLDGIAQSGLAEGDIQVVRVGQVVAPGGIIIKGKNNQPVRTRPIGNDDVQEEDPGTYVANATDIIVTAGTNGRLQTCPEGDDYVVEPQIKVGANNVCDTQATGDDVQIVAVGADGGTPGNNPCVGAGPNGVLDSVPVPDDELNTVPQQVILAGANKKVDTIVKNDDDELAVVDGVEVIVDGGNKIAETGLGPGDEQVIWQGEGLSDAVSIIAAPDRVTGMPRELTTRPAGDDNLIIPGGEFAGTPPFVFDDERTVTDPDGDTRVENYATVDDGEYFSWEPTNIDYDGLIPAPSVNNIAVVGGIVRNPLSFQILHDPADPSVLLAYVSNGMDIYSLTSQDGTDWATLELVLEPGDNGGEDDPVVLAGVNGICETAATGNDIQLIPVSKGRPDSIGIFAGRDGIFQSKLGGDDHIDGLFIRTGKDGINDSILGGDDWLMIPSGQGQPDSACVGAGDNGLRDTLDSQISGDDRPPFFDLNSNSSIFSFYLPEPGEPAVTELGSAGFDAFAVTDPFVFKHEDTYYMFYAGWGALSEPEAHRPDKAATEKFGPCVSPGMDRLMLNDKDNFLSVFNADNTPGVIIAPRIGLATSSDGIHWKKRKAPVIDIGNTCAGLVDLSILAGLGFDLEALFNVEPYLLSGMDFDFSGALAPRVRADKAADGEPVFSIIYTGLNYRRPYLSILGAAAGILASTPDQVTKRELFAGFRTGVGMARSFDLKKDWTKLKANNPLFSGGLFYAPTQEEFPHVFEEGDGYFAYYGEENSGDPFTPADDFSYIAIATRHGTVYSLCMAVKNSAQTAPLQAGLILFLMLLPAAIVLLRRMWVKAKSRN